MTTLPVSRLGATPWQGWVAEVGAPALDAAEWAARTLAQAVLVALAWPLRLAWLVLSRVRWGTGETVFCTVLAAGPVGLLVRLYPSVRWPTAEQALTDLQQVGAVLLVAWLVLYLHAGAAAAEFHSHGNASRRKVVRHEKAHQRALRRAGAGGSRRKVWRTANGRWAGKVSSSRGRFNRLPRTHRAAVYLAGAKAAPGTNCDHDNAAAAQILAGASARERDEAHRLADQWAR